jgi:hypothetical protein
MFVIGKKNILFDLFAILIEYHAVDVEPNEHFLGQK